MVRIDDAIIARIKKEGEVFEVLVDCDKALDYRDGKIEDLSEVLATPNIYKDVKQGEKASENEMKKLFKTESEKEVAQIIVKEGEIQLTADHKNRLREVKLKQIVTFIHRNAVDAKTGLPHPVQRIESAMQEAKVRIDEFKPVEMQVQEVITKLRPLLPIKVEVREIEVQIPSQYAGSAYGSVKRLGKILRDEWLNDGSLKAVVEIPAGVQEELENELNKLTKGDVNLKILNKR